MLAHGKTVAAPVPVQVPTEGTASGPAEKIAAVKFAEDCFNSISSAGRKLFGDASAAWGSVVFTASADLSTGTPMCYDEVRLFLQSYNAGPYACLKYKGTVPYRETRNYVPKILKYYQQNLSDTPYDHIIVEKATKYGLDPQLIRAIAKAESGFDSSIVSHAGARGLMQVMPCVWSEVRKRYRFKWNYDSNVFDPEKNVEVACAYLAWLRYDFLPRHFAEFPANPEAPVVVKRDKRSFRKIERISAREQIMISQQAERKKAALNPGA